MSPNAEASVKRLIPLVWLGLVLLSCAPKQESASLSAPPDSEGFVTADDGIRLFYRKVGDGASAVVIPAAVFLHPALSGLADGRTLIFYDMRNRGRSDSVPAERENSIQRDVADLENLRAQLGFERVSLVGWSYLGLMVALYALEHPERVDRIVQIGPVPMRFDTRYAEGLGPADYMAAMDSAAVADLRRLRAQGLTESDPQQYCEREWAVTRFTLVGNPAHVDRLPASPCASPNEWPAHFARHLERHFGSVRRLSLPRDSVARLAKPVLVVHGTRDRNAPYGAGREWAMTLPEARLLTVEGAAHCPWADEPDLVFGALRTFLGGEWPAGVEKVERLERSARPGS
jgi:pimeloyl-ACP methyl ester carboxylesterase